MACKHAVIPGSDPCVRYASGVCRTRKLLSNKKYRSFEKYSGWSNNNHAGAAAEHLVACDLYRRKVLELTWPDDSSSFDDMHARYISGWFSVQVKVGRENTRTGHVTLLKRGQAIRSDIIAVVGLRTMTIRYLPNKKELPEELRMVQ